ncbi:MarC family protein [Candidatus Sumerlaeota bacterium]|nr:MarC family protein [Candidatus Sumerlaeota bacterium]
MAADLILMLVILNPFAQMLYLSGLMSEAEAKTFRSIFFQASILTLAICVLFALCGEMVLSRVFQIELPALQIFGGLIILTVAYKYILSGSEGVPLFKGEYSEIAQQITLPLHVGPGLLWICILIGERHDAPIATLIIIAGIVLNAAMVLLYHHVFKHARRRMELALLKYFAIAMRLNALLIGAVSVQMIIEGVTSLIRPAG